jgi:hypothetical protein
MFIVCPWLFVLVSLMNSLFIVLNRHRVQFIYFHLYSWGGPAAQCPDPPELINLLLNYICTSTKTTIGAQRGAADAPPVSITLPFIPKF